MIRSRIILLVEDNPDDADLTLAAFQESKTFNEVVVARDGEEALAYLFATGSFAERNPKLMPEVVQRLSSKQGTQTAKRFILKHQR